MKPGTTLESPDGRRFVLGVQKGVNQQGEPLTTLQRADRKKGEAMSLWRRVSEVETWRVV